MDVNKVQKTVKEIGDVIRENECTGEEYMIVLHNLVAHILADNEKKLEKQFMQNVRQDVLQRRLKKLRDEHHKKVQSK